MNSPIKPKFAKKNRETILPSKTALMINYAVSVLIFALTFIMAIMLATYYPQDNCWFKASDDLMIYNKLGIFGAYFSDLLLSIFGFSAWWIVLGLFYLGYRKIIRVRINAGNWYSIVQILSFLLLLIGSSAFEYIVAYGYNSSYLHNGYGGMFGNSLFHFFSNIVGQTATSAIALTAVIIGFSCSFSLYLMLIVEQVGLFVEFIYNIFSKLISRKQVTITEEQYPSKSMLTTNSIHEGFDDDFALLLSNLDENGSLGNNNDVVIDNPFTAKKMPRKIKPNILKVLTQSQHMVLDAATEKTDTAPVMSPLSPVFNNRSVNENMLPSTSLLNQPKQHLETLSAETVDFVSQTIENKLLEFGVDAKITNAETGPVITRYELLPSRGVRGDKIVGLGKEIARGLALTNVRIVETIPGKNSMGIEVPNFKRQIIYLKEIFDSPAYLHNSSKLALALGKDIAGQVVVTDLAKMPHLLVAGTTGSGKSVAINVMILSILFQASKDEVKFIMIDPKMVELSFYQDIPHLLAPVVTDMTQAANALKWTVGEMERRYKIMAKIGCKNIISFNQKIEEAIANGEDIFNPFPLSVENPEILNKWTYIVVIIDELADLMMVAGKKIEQYIARIAQKARAVGIHLIVATQRPSVDVITGLIKANIPARIAFQVSSKIDSRTILDQTGADALLGQGDMLFLQPGTGFTQRVHGAFVNDDELNKVVEFLRASGTPDYIDGILTGEDISTDTLDLEDGEDAEKDVIFDEAIKFIYDTKRCSISSLQTRFGIGYNRAARIMTNLEQVGVVARNDRGGYQLLRTTSDG